MRRTNDLCYAVVCHLRDLIGGVDVRGGAPATRETDLLRPLHMVEEVHAIVLTGGSAFGLDAAGGAMRYLEEHSIGIDVGVAKVPIVPAAAILDLGFGSASVRPDAAAGYHACEQATAEAIPQGNIGAGTGATVGKLLGPGFMMKGGLGSASTRMDNGTLVGAIVVVNALGDVIDPQTQQILAGARNPIGGFIASNPFSNTTIAVVATNAWLSKDATNKVAQMAHNGIAQVIRPAHTMFDGDTVFSLSLGKAVQSQPDPAATALKVSMIGAAAAATLARAILNAVLNATTLHGVPASHT